MRTNPKSNFLAIRRPNPAADPVAWALVVNSRWTVRNGLASSAADYLQSLSAETKVASCRIAAAMDQSRRRLDPALDPRPFFYAGLFALADDAQVACHLNGHHFTRALVRRGAPETCDWLASLSPATRALVDRIHSMLQDEL